MSSAIPVPSKMKAARMHQTGGPDVIVMEEIDTPEIAPDSDNVLIKVEWAGVNYIDTYLRSGLYPVPLPAIFGLECVGTIVQLPSSPSVLQSEAYNAKGLKPGDRVASMEYQTFAEYHIAPWHKLAKLPSASSSSTFDPRAGASFIQGLTALAAMREAYAVQKGDWILVRSVAGGLGGQLAQIGRALGAHVIGTTSTPSKAALAKDLGVEHIIVPSPDSDGPSLVDEIMRLTGGKGVSAIFDGVGKDTWDENFSLIARKGTIVSLGNASGNVPPFDILKLSQKNIKVVRPRIAAYLTTSLEFESYTSEYIALLSSGAVRVPIHKEYTFSAEGVREAQEEISGRGTSGKLLIRVAGTD